MVEIICAEGTKVYVYARSIGTGDTVKYNDGTQRVYAYGILPETIEARLDAITNSIYGIVRGVLAYKHPANKDYVIVERMEPSEPVEEQGEELLDSE
jgi:hypothetical protein